MKVKLYCTECEERFTMPGSFDWNFVECPGCGFHGEVIGRIVDGVDTYFADEEETAPIRVVDLEKDGGSAH